VLAHKMIICARHYAETVQNKLSPVLLVSQLRCRSPARNAAGSIRGSPIHPK
jgi:hypothetical protein